MKKTIYVAYGSNMNLEQMAQRCPTAKVVGNGYIEDHELVFRGHPTGAVATIEKQSDSRVPVVLWELLPGDEAALDRYEGFPYLYRKATITVKLDKASIDAMVYIMNEGRAPGAPNHIYLEIIKEGYETAGFDTKILMDAAQKYKTRS